MGTDEAQGAARPRAQWGQEGLSPTGSFLHLEVFLCSGCCPFGFDLWGRTVPGALSWQLLAAPS